MNPSGATQPKPEGNHQNPRYICADALQWLPEQGPVGSIVTSIPDAAEVGLSGDMDAYWRWALQAATACMESVSDTGVLIFVQTDRLQGGIWHSKSHAIMNASEDAEMDLLWHKIALRRAPGMADLFRPTYRHMLAFSRESGPGPRTPDVVQDSKPLWANGVGVKVTEFVVSFAARPRYGNRLLDPFCGRGTFPAMAAAMGLEATGVDIDPEQIKRAEKLRFEPLPRPW